MKNIISILLTVLLLCALCGTAMAESVETLLAPVELQPEEPEQEAAEEPNPVTVETEPEQAEEPEILFGGVLEDNEFEFEELLNELEAAFSEGNVLIVCVIAMAAVTALVVLIAKKRAKG